MKNPDKNLPAFKPIKKIAGEFLLYFYFQQRKNGSPLVTYLRFSNKYHSQSIELQERGRLETDILKLANQSHIDAFNAFNYLYEKGFIDCKKSSDSGGDNYISLKVSACGIDIIEGIERGPEEKKEFNITFNFQLAENINIDSLIKTEIGSLLKASLI